MRNHDIVYENQQVNRLVEQSDFFSVNPSLLRAKFTWFCHSRESGNPVFPSIYWIPAFAGMTFGFPLSHVFRVTFRDEPKKQPKVRADSHSRPHKTVFQKYNVGEPFHWLPLRAAVECRPCEIMITKNNKSIL
ncbi:MAG: hypothetical protein NT009_12675 [Proteobacteria bacterium]|nr:hypothetical protein [Pseudomonadota bacterium]